MKIQTLLLAFCLIAACGDDDLPDSQDKTTAAGWNYRYQHLPEKKNGWKIVIVANSPWAFQDHNAWADAVASDMLQYSGYGDVTPADKAAMMEGLDSNAVLYQTISQTVAEIYVEKGEEEKFMPAIIAMFQDYELDPDYFETLKQQISDNIAEAEAQKDSAFEMEKIMSYAIFDQNNNIQTNYDLSSENLEKLTLDEVNAWIAHIKTLSGFMIGVAGTDNPESLEPYIDAMLEGMSQDPNGYQIPKINPPAKTLRIAFENPEIDKVSMTWGAAWPDVSNSQEFMPLDYVTQILDGDKTKTRLASIREELRASYGFQSFVFPKTINQYQLGIGGESDLEHQNEVLQRIADVNASMVNEKPSEKEFEAAKSSLTSYYDDAYKDENAAAYYMALSLDPSFSMDWKSEKSIYENAQLDDVYAAIQEEYPATDAWMQVIVTPDASTIDADCVLTDWREVPSCFQ